MSTIRIKMLIEYDGTDFHGWQLQPEVRSVQGEIESSLSRICGRDIRITGSGRTDAGVHALGQVAHSDIGTDEYDKVRTGLPSVLPSDIAIVSLEETDPSFHARFDAVRRSYRYTLLKERKPMLRRYSCFISMSRTLDTEAMQKAAGYSLGTNDWKAMSKEGSSTSSWLVDVHHARVAESMRGWTFNIQANRFLRGLVRIWVGTLVRIGSGSESPELIRELFSSGDRLKAGVSMPARGLTLMEVRYS